LQFDLVGGRYEQIAAVALADLLAGDVPDLT
jgi:hypothetical protein